MYIIQYMSLSLSLSPPLSPSLPLSLSLSLSISPPLSLYIPLSLSISILRIVGSLTLSQCLCRLSLCLMHSSCTLEIFFRWWKSGCTNIGGTRISASNSLRNCSDNRSRSRIFLSGSCSSTMMPPMHADETERERACTKVPT